MFQGLIKMLLFVDLLTQTYYPIERATAKPVFLHPMF